MPTRLDLNADLGEGFGAWKSGDDDALLRVITSANVACGFHAGDPSIMRRVCERAVEHGVAIGAQVGYRDLAGFGRRRIDIAPDDLTAEVLYQLGALAGFARAAGDRVRYLKPHGALYNTAARDPVQAGAIVAALKLWTEPLPVLTQAGSGVGSAGNRGRITRRRRGIRRPGLPADGLLQPRTEPGRGAARCRRRSWPGRSGWPAPAGFRAVTGEQIRSRPGRSAYTVTPRARSRSPERCAPG